MMYCVQFDLIFHTFEKLPKLKSISLHVQDLTVGPVHFGSTPFRMSVMPALEVEQWIRRNTGFLKEMQTEHFEPRTAHVQVGALSPPV